MFKQRWPLNQCLFDWLCVHGGGVLIITCLASGRAVLIISESKVTHHTQNRLNYQITEHDQCNHHMLIIIITSHWNCIHQFFQSWRDDDPVLQKVDQHHPSIDSMSYMQDKIYFRLIYLILRSPRITRFKIRSHDLKSVATIYNPFPWFINRGHGL